MSASPGRDGVCIAALKRLRARTDDPDPDVRYLARRELHEHCRDRRLYRSPRNLPPDALESALDAHSPVRRWRAARTCRSCGNGNLLDPVVERLSSDEDPWIRAELVRAAGALVRAAPGSKLPEVVRALGCALRDTDERVRANSIEVLAELGHPPGLTDLRPLLTGTHHRARAAALVAAGRVFGPHPEVLQSLWEMALSGSLALRSSGEYALRALRPLWGR